MGETGELNLKVGEDYVQRIAQPDHPERAVLELVWNSIDAEAMSISVDLDRDTTDAIKTVRVSDDGHGISPDEVEATFGYLGKSWKAMKDKTKNGKRQLHGRHGEGRLRVFALGTRVEWVSTAQDSAEKLHRVRISGSYQNPQKFSTDVSQETSRSLGTVVVAHNDAQRPLTVLEREKMVPFLRMNLAPILLNEPDLVVKYEGHVITAQDEIRDDTHYELTLPIGDPPEAKLRIIEWKRGKHRTLHFGPDEEHFQWEVPGDDFEKALPFSAYVSWAGFKDPEKGSQVTLGNLANEENDVGALWHATKKRATEHFFEKRRERRREQIEKWKSDEIYPYRGEPATEAEEAERQVFDVVSSSFAPHIPQTKKHAKLTLHLLQNAVQHDPQSLTKILNEVVQLRPEERETLAGLLEETSLSAIIKSANMVASRHKFLQALEHLIFDPSDSGEVKERDHLHKILENELWIFGEQYNFMSSERGLTQLLQNHLKLEGLPTDSSTTVTKWDGTAGRTDLHLAVKRKEFGAPRHLIVELKAPSVTAGRKEQLQVVDYGDAIFNNPAFNSSGATWEVVLVVADYDQQVRNQIRSKDLRKGLIHEPLLEHQDQPKVRVYVRRWRDIIDENKERLDYLIDSLEHQPSFTDGLDYVRQQYGDLLPSRLQAEEEPDELLAAVGAEN